MYTVQENSEVCTYIQTTKQSGMYTVQQTKYRIYTLDKTNLYLSVFQKRSKSDKSLSAVIHF